MLKPHALLLVAMLLRSTSPLPSNLWKKLIVPTYELALFSSCSRQRYCSERRPRSVRHHGFFLGGGPGCFAAGRDTATGRGGGGGFGAAALGRDTAANGFA
jgi:hypothetical protein